MRTGIVIECVKGWFADGGSDLPIMEGERFFGEYQQHQEDLVWVSMEGNLNPGMEFQFVGMQLLAYFRVIHFKK